MADRNTIFDAAFEYQMAGMSEEMAKESAAIDKAKDDEIARLRAALKSIADNTCCGGCGEAAKVAAQALK